MSLFNRVGLYWDRIGIGLGLAWLGEEEDGILNGRTFSHMNKSGQLKSKQITAAITECIKVLPE